MKYNKDKALILAEKHGVPTATLRTWKHRGVIPDKYRDYSPSCDKVEQKKIVKCLADNRLKRSSFFSGVVRYADVRRSARLSKHEAKSIKGLLLSLARRLEEKSRSETGIKVLITEEDHIKKFVVFDSKVVQRSYRPNYFLSSEEINASADAAKDLAAWITSCF